MDQHTSALDAIWLGKGSLYQGMLPLRTHTALLGETVFEIFHEQPASSTTWQAVADQLRMASFVVDVHAKAPPQTQPDLCDFSGSDEAFGEMTRLWLAGTMIFALVWQAYELSVLARKPSSKSQGKEGTELLAKTMHGDRLIHLPTIATSITDDLIGILPKSRSEKLLARTNENDVRRPAEIAASSLAFFRNALIHGDLYAPLTMFGDDDDDPIEEDNKIQIFHHAIRLTLLLIQALFADAFPEDEEVERAGECVSIGDLMTRLHVRDEQVTY